LLTERLEMLQGFTADENLLLATLGSKSARPRISSELQKRIWEALIEGYKEAAQSNPNLRTHCPKPH
jgi:hypothetical protein